MINIFLPSRSVKSKGSRSRETSRDRIVFVMATVCRRGDAPAGDVGRVLPLGLYCGVDERSGDVKREC